MLGSLSYHLVFHYIGSIWVMPFKYLEDEALADIAFLAYGQGINEMFRDAAMAICSLLTDIEKLDTSISFPIDIQHESVERVLYQFLDEIIYLKDAELFFP
ncbi:MAG: archease, partial [Candidatus Kariarchaeaceae archaeon]